MSGLKAQQLLTRRGYTLPVIFISGHGDIPMAVRAVQAGAMDFLEKPFSDQALLDRVDAALEADRAHRAKLADRAGVAAGLESLTPREYEVLLRLLDGKVNKIIARELEVSTRTVEIHRARVLQKMGVGNASQLVRRVLDSGLPVTLSTPEPPPG
jgi:FixJ family two-component response regulator